MKLSIIIASYKRKQLLGRLRKSLRYTDSRSAEVITIEDCIGLAKARNMGWHKASSEYIAFIDDDAVATEDWVDKIIAFTKKYPNVAIFGGPYTSLNQDDIPEWIPPELTQKVLPGAKPRALDLGKEWLNGTNFIVKKSVLEQVGGFNESLGISGKKRGYGEETDLQIRLHNLGYKVWYDPQIKVEHEFASFKMNMWYLLKNQFTHGYNSKEVFKDLKITNRKHTAKTIFSRILEPRLPLKRRIYYFLAPQFYLAGIFFANLR